MKQLIGIFYGLGGLSIVVLAAIDFTVGGAPWPKRVAMLAGLVIFGVMYLAASRAWLLGKLQLSVVANRLARPLTTAALVVGSVMIGWFLSLHALTAHGLAMAVTGLTYLLCSWLETLPTGHVKSRS
ncbi:MAG: hypothetical protein LKJ69_00685 [Lactobacillus sp.]|nr:hypothetical protein [Lactobacillus sp.]MCI2031897.1 hypothetical protein [Lactobacillus sp.]